VLALWTIISGLVLVRIGFFRGEPLAAAPRRENHLTIGLIVAVALLYLGAQALGAQAGQFLERSLTGVPRVAGTATSSTGASVPTRGDSSWLHAGAGLANILLAVYLLLILRHVFADGLGGFGLDVRRVIRGLGLGVIAAMLMVPWYIWVSLGTEQLSHLLRHGKMPVHPVLEALRDNPPRWAQVTLIATAVLCAPLIEEIVFRGVLQSYLLRLVHLTFAGDKRSSGGDTGVPSAGWRWFGIVGVSILFAAIHIPFMGPEAFLPLFALAITLGYVYERTGNLWACMTLHGLFNLTVVVANSFQVR